MLKQDSEELYNELKAMNAAITPAPFFTKFYPIVADNGAKEPYCNYSLSKTPIGTKDGLRYYDLTFTVVADSYNAMADGVDHLTAYFDNHIQFKFQGSNPRYVDAMDRAVIDTTYTFKIR